MSQATVTIKWSSVQRKAGLPKQITNLADNGYDNYKSMTMQELVVSITRACNQMVAKQFGCKPFKKILITFNGRFKRRGGHCEWIDQGSDSAHIMVASGNSCPSMGQRHFVEVIGHELIHAKQMAQGELKWRGGDFEWMGDRVRKDLGLKYRQFGHEVEAFENQGAIRRAAVASLFSAPKESFACPHCGKEYQSRQGRYRHLRSKACQ